jgi:hypothetical protein
MLFNLATLLLKLLTFKSLIMFKYLPLKLFLAILLAFLTKLLILSKHSFFLLASLIFF